MTTISSWRPGMVLIACLVFTHSWADDLWLKDPITGCDVWTDRIDPAGEVVSWNGECMGGKASGNGALSWFRAGKLLGRYDGGMAFGRLHGRGVMYYAAETGYDRFEGDFVKGGMLGHLEYEGANGDRFEGMVEDDGHTGSGVFVDAAGEWYEGDIKDGLYHGKGVLILQDGGRLEGRFVEGKANGKGLFTTPDGTSYEANFVNGKIDGKVLVNRPDGSREEQQWKMDQRVDAAVSREDKS